MDDGPNESRSKQKRPRSKPPPPLINCTPFDYQPPLFSGHTLINSYPPPPTLAYAVATSDDPGEASAADKPPSGNDRLRELIGKYNRDAAMIAKGYKAECNQAQEALKESTRREALALEHRNKCQNKLRWAESDLTDAMEDRRHHQAIVDALESEGPMEVPTIDPCAICMEYRPSMYLLGQCGHQLCESCDERHRKTSATCPSCRQDIFDESIRVRN